MKVKFFEKMISIKLLSKGKKNKKKIKIKFELIFTKTDALRLSKHNSNILNIFN